MVVVLVTIVGASVALSLGARGDRDLETTAERVLGAINHAAEAAVISGRAYGLYLTPEACSMVVYDGESWREAPTGSLGARLGISPPYALQGRGVYAVPGRVPPAPQAIFLPDGDHDLADIAVVNTLSGEAYVLEPALAGRYALTHVAASP